MSLLLKLEEVEVRGDLLKWIGGFLVGQDTESGNKRSQIIMEEDKIWSSSKDHSYYL